MRWHYIEVFEKGIKCSICQTDIQEVSDCNWYYVPILDDSEEDNERGKQIEMLFKVDRFANFQICENCMQGYCGAVPGLDANNWLEEKLVEYGKKKPEEIAKITFTQGFFEDLFSETYNEYKQLMQKGSVNPEDFPPPPWEAKK
jgi:hypothetical protein